MSAQASDQGEADPSRLVARDYRLIWSQVRMALTAGRPAQELRRRCGCTESA
jgi:hypothetical protein